MATRTERLRTRFEQVCARKGLDPKSQRAIDAFVAKGGVFARVGNAMARQSGGKLAMKGRPARVQKLKGKLK